MARTKKSLKAPALSLKAPGAKGQAIIDEDREYVSPAYSRLVPMVFGQAEGAEIFDVDGHRYLDFAASFAVLNQGARHPKILAAVRAQLDRFTLAATDWFHEPVARLAHKLAEITPGELEKTFFASTGSEGIETAMKLVRYVTRRPIYLAFEGSFHGRTFGALSITSSKSFLRKRYAPLLPDVVFTPFAYCYRCYFGLTYPECGLHCAHALDRTLESVAPAEDVAALFFEPVQGEGGYVVPPKGYWDEVRKICRQQDILMVADEIQTAFGRTGKLFACEHWGLEPDVMVLAKALGGGFPLSACIARAELMDAWEPGAHDTTFGGNPLVTAAGLAAVEVTIEERLPERAAKLGLKTLERLAELKRRHPLIGDVRGLGLMIGVELVRDHKTREPATAEAAQVAERCFRKGVLLTVVGRYYNLLRIAPPLVMTEAQLEEGLGIIDEALGEVERSHGLS